MKHDQLRHHRKVQAERPWSYTDEIKDRGSELCELSEWAQKVTYIVTYTYMCNGYKY